jgi:hypothetical protein
VLREHTHVIIICNKVMKNIKFRIIFIHNLFPLYSFTIKRWVKSLNFVYKSNDIYADNISTRKDSHRKYWLRFVRSFRDPKMNGNGINEIWKMINIVSHISGNLYQAINKWRNENALREYRAIRRFHVFPWSYLSLFSFSYEYSKICASCEEESSFRLVFRI